MKATPEVAVPDGKGDKPAITREYENNNNPTEQSLPGYARARSADVWRPTQNEYVPTGSRLRRLAD